MSERAITAETGQVCPSCGDQCSRDEADVGIGTIYGPWACYCGWSGDPRYDVRDGARTERGYAVDQWGGLTPRSAPAKGGDHVSGPECRTNHHEESPSGA
ncbi:hypothetical protein ACG83_10855 [Frankia sp. R43]|uniref:hypothetical protein n=1 Tax=Frankia sp. R43 TaxID=269536 RepID=UPI0006CA1D01|nr:hypothetical protein [Frankia sp. R43]KPM55764.1 hypothetical protein ACG83_10855 [Frankia sp. R43]